MIPDLTPFRRFRIDLAYDGRQFSGWQSQPEGKTVQDALHKALKLVCPEVSAVQGSGRTDAGVSASQQVAHFDVPGEGVRSMLICHLRFGFSRVMRYPDRFIRGSAPLAKPTGIRFAAGKSCPLCNMVSPGIFGTLRDWRRSGRP